MASPRQRRKHEEDGNTICANDAEQQHGTSAASVAGHGPLHPPSSPPQTPGVVMQAQSHHSAYRSNDLAATPTSSHRCGNTHHRTINHHLDPYKTLSLRRDATVAEITAAYRKLSLLHHPSRRRNDSGMFVAVSASYQTLIEPRYRRRYDNTTKSKSRTDEETGQLYYPALGTMGTGESEGMSMSMSAGGGGIDSMSLGLGPTTTATSENGERLDGCSTATSSYPSHPNESFGGSAFSGLAGLGSGVALSNMATKTAAALDEDDNDIDEGGNDNACWTGAACGGACGAAETLADLDLAGVNSLEEVENMDDKKFAGDNPPAVSTSGSSDAAGSPPNHNLGNNIFGRGRLMMGNRSPRSIGSESDYDVGAEALDALLLSPSADADDIILTSLRQHQQPRMRRSGGGGGGVSSSGLGRYPLLSDGTQDGGQHYTSDQTDLLFGGPLAPLYRARNFAPFEDPHKLFDRVMGSAVFQSSGDNHDNTGTKETKCPRYEYTNGKRSGLESCNQLDESGFLALAALPVSTQTSVAMKTTIVAIGASSFESDSESGAVESSSVSSAREISVKESPTKNEQGADAEGGRKIVKRTERVINGRRMIRTETTTTDPKTGKRRTTVEVTKEDIVDDKGGEKDAIHTGQSTDLMGTATAGGRGDSRGFCNQCGATSVAPDAGGAVSTNESNPLLCGHCGRMTPRADQAAPHYPDPTKNEPTEEEPLLERMSRQITEFFTCGVGCGASSCFAE